LAVAIIATSVLLPHTSLRPLAVLAYVLGSLVIGAQVIGHEYGARTLGALMTQPVPRPVAFGAKLAVSGVLIALLTAAATPVLFDLREFRYPSPARIALTVAMMSIFVAPVLTMLCRSTIAAVVFSIGIPGTLKVTGDLIGFSRFGAYNARAIDTFSEQFFWNGMFAICAFAVPASWLIFDRLQVIEGRGTQIHLPRWFGRPEGNLVARPLHPLRQLVRKELHLHQMTFLIVGFYLAGAGVAAMLDLAGRPGWARVMVPISALCLCAIPVLLGATSIAEERSIGTLGSQSLLPIAAWKQWTVKMGVAILLALLLAVALPAVMLVVMELSDDAIGDTRRTLMLASTLAILLTAGGIYASALAGNSLRALLGSVGMVTATVVLLNVAVSGLYPLMRQFGIHQTSRRLDHPELVVSGFGILAAAMLLHMAYLNRIERRGVVLAAQVGGLVTIAWLFIFCAYWLRL
jgi:hypothetical protein